MKSTSDSSRALDFSTHAFFTQSTGNLAIDADLEYIYNLDWSKSSIGPIASWPPELLVLINLMVLSPQPQLFLLGPDSIILYNTAYGRLLYDHHPQYQGRPIHLNQALIDNAVAISRIVDNATTKARPANENQIPFFFQNNGRLEEVFLSATMVQLPQSLGGYHATTYNTTPEAVQARRDHTLEQISKYAYPAKDLSSLWKSILMSLSEADKDVPFAALYCADTKLVKDPYTNVIRREVDPNRFHLEGCVGCFNPPIANDIFLNSSEEWITSLRLTVNNCKPVVLDRNKSALPASFYAAAGERCYGDSCHEAVAFPSILEKGAEVHCILILGLAPRRPYDHGYDYWIRRLYRVIANAVGSIAITDARALARENEMTRASKERDILAKELSLRKQEAALATGKIQRMLGIMQSANVGVFECLPSGQLIQINEAFSKLSNCPQNLFDEDSCDILSLGYPDDTPSLRECWKLIASGKPLTFTVRFQSGNNEDKSITRWVQIACVPVLNEISEAESVIGCVTDISAQKKVEQEAVKRAEVLEQLRVSEARLLEDAIEARRAQGNFIDMTSHEIRNPLSVVVHCSDALAQILSDMRTILDGGRSSTRALTLKAVDAEKLSTLHQESTEIVDTIMSCTMHQKRITDDILSLSKLDSDLLEISPTIFEIETFLAQVYNTFASEATRAGVKLETLCDPSMTSLGTSWVKADPGRLMQVLVNLVSNAIKFTKDQPGSRQIVITVGASKTKSMKILEDINMARNSEADEKADKPMSKDDFLLWFQVRDTGCGMDAGGRAKMFARFSQASPKTHGTYGGSGLGLFVSMKLVTLQGGEIGFSSEEGFGSNFAFYVESSKAAPPDALMPDVSVPATDSAALDSPTKVLLVEDNLVNQKVLKKQLTRIGFIVHTANNGQDAFDFVTNTRHWTRSDPADATLPAIDVILMDIEMPVLNGLDSARLIRKAERNGELGKHIPIVAVTANARPEQLREATEAGMDDAISKPFHVRDLKALIKQLVPKSRTERIRPHGAAHT